MTAPWQLESLGRSAAARPSPAAGEAGGDRAGGPQDSAVLAMTCGGAAHLWPGRPAAGRLTPEARGLPRILFTRAQPFAAC